MTLIPVRWLAILSSLWLGSAVQALATPIYYNVDYQTLPNGPIRLLNPSASKSTNAWTLSGDAKNLSSTRTYTDIRFLVQFFYIPTPASAFTFTDATDTWTSVGSRVMKVTGSPLTMSMDDTTAPASFIKFSQTGAVGSHVTLPYINIGTLGPNAMQHFSFTLSDTGPGTGGPFNLVGSFISTVPEPSSIVMAALGGLGLLIAVRRRCRR